MTTTATTDQIQVQVLTPDTAEHDKKIKSLKADLAQARTDGAEANAKAAGHRGRLQQGDSSVSAGDLIKTDAEVERAALLIAGLETQIGRAERRRPNADLRLGVAVAQGLTKITDEPVVVTHTLPKDAEETAPGDGALYVLVAEPGKESVSGVLSGQVELVQVRASNRIGLDVAVVLRRLKDAQVEAKSDRVFDRINGNVSVLSVNLHIETAFAEVPVIMDKFVSERGLTSAEIAARWAVRDGLFSATSDRAVCRSSSDQSIIVPSGQISGGKVTEKDGLRYVEFSATFNGIMSQYSAKPGEALRRVIEDLPGLAVGNLGRIVEAVGTVEADNSQGMRAWTVKITATAVSKAPH